MRSRLQTFSFRLKPGEDLKKGILGVAQKKKINAGIVITCVGSLTALNLRFANRSKGTLRKGYHEILSLTGTFSKTAGHFHLTAANRNGDFCGGHLLEGNTIFTTAEIVIGILPEIVFARERDVTTGFLELVVRKSKTRRRKA